MGLILRVTYAATDGSMPESVELEWDQPPAAEVLLPVVSRLVAAPGGRLATATPRFVLVDNAQKGEILVLCGDGLVRNAGDAMAKGRNDYAGSATETLRAGEWIEMASGKWRRLETT